MLERYPQDVKIVVKQFPLTSHRFAFPAAMGALAAGKQGKFWEFHQALLKNHNALNDEKILSIARGLKLDMTRYADDSKSPGNRALILEDIEEGRKLGVRGTPTVYLNGKNVKGRELGNLVNLVAEELAALKQPAQQ